MIVENAPIRHVYACIGSSVTFGDFPIYFYLIDVSNVEVFPALLIKMEVITHMLPHVIIILPEGVTTFIETFFGH